MSNPVEKMTIKNLADELGVSKNTVRNQLVNSGFDLAQYKENGIIMLDKELIGVVRSIYRSKSDQFTGQLPVNNTGSDFPLEKENEFLRDQLAEKDKHISELTEMIRDQQKLTLLQQQK
ncbi:helix-turn-helix domain-containing protein, partial [Enterococcus faecium]|nr:helix-turn-helix domain-containing protein [Enterococcus faecium]